MTVFFDTSALAKRYLSERGSKTVNGIVEGADGIAVSILFLPELASTLSRLVREGQLKESDRDFIKAEALADLADADVCQVSAVVVASTIALLEAGSLRTLDAIQVASAYALGSELFVSADRRQLAAARLAGLDIVDVS